MLFTVVIYILALFAVLNNLLLIISLLFTAFAILSINKNYFPLKYIIVWTIIFYLGVANTSNRLKDVDELLSIAPVNSIIKGTVLSIPKGIAEGKPKFFFDVDYILYDSISKDIKNEKVLVTINNFDGKKFDDLKVYNSYELNGRLAKPFKAGNPSQFDYGNYLRNHDAYAVFYAKDYKLLENEKTFAQKALCKINDYRDKVISTHAQFVKTPYLEILGGIVFGDDAVSPSKEIKESFVNSGLLHILAASGMNVAFIFGFFVLLLRFLRVGFKTRTALGMAMVVLYALMTGLGASIIRAAIMLLFVMAGKLIDRDAHSISLLSFVAFLMLIYNPLWINDVGFQLSFIVTFGLLLMTPLIARFKNGIINYLVGTISVPVIAQLWVIPLQIFYFNNISVYSVFANIMSVPIVAVISFGGFISSLVSIIIPPIADFICRIFDFVLSPCLILLVKISDFWGGLPNSSVQTTHPDFIQLFVYYLILILLTALINKDLREKYLKTLIKATVISLTILLISLIPVKNSNLEITAFDVGNADSFLIKTPENKYIMVDTGRAGYNQGKSQAEIIVLKYFKDRGIKELDSLIVTHFDNDHCGGVVDLLNSLKVKTLYVNSLNHESKAAKEIYDKAKVVETNVVLVSDEEKVINEKALSLVNYLPAVGKDDNEKSIITLLKYNDFTMLFTGDSGVYSLNNIIDKIPQNITVLKVPHHGAKDGLDRNLIAKLNPKYSIISVGENKFGHPSLYTLYLLEKSKVLRTDIDNSIKFVVKKDSYRVYTYDTERRKYIKF